MKDLRRLREAGRYPPVLFVFRDPVERGERFFAKEWPEARAIADETGGWWRTFSVKPLGSLWSLFGPGVFLAAFRSLRKGHFVGLPGEAPLTEPGLFLLNERGEVLKRHAFEHIGDHPDFARFGGITHEAKQR